MANERNYVRFYTLLKLLPGADKELLVAQYTDGRTTSLRETTPQEYDLMCRDMERLTGHNARIAGKAFRHISIDELEVLAVKLRAIKRKKEASPCSSESRGTIVMLSVNHSTEN